MHGTSNVLPKDWASVHCFPTCKLKFGLRVFAIRHEVRTCYCWLWTTCFGFPWPLLLSVVARPPLLCFTSLLLCFRAGLQHLYLFSSSEASGYCGQKMYRIHRMKLETTIVRLTNLNLDLQSL